MPRPARVVNRLVIGDGRVRWWWGAALAVGGASLLLLPGWQEPLVVGLAVVGTVAAYVARRHLGPLVLVGLLGLGLAGVWPAAFLASYLVALHRSRAGTAAWALSVAAVVLAREHVPGMPTPVAGHDDVVSAIVNALVVPLVLGWWVRERRRVLAGLHERAERLVRERAAVVARARAEERARIAREMHDVVAHKVSLMVIHAGAIDMGTSEPSSREGAQLVQDLGREAMSNLRDVLAVLRDEQEASARTRPTPGLAEIDELVEHSRRAGLTVLRQDLGAPRQVSAAVGAAAYRVVQESLTNVHRHAGDAVVEVRLEWAARTLDVNVHDRPSVNRPESLPSSGLGLVGLRERVAAVGGRFTAGTTGGGFQVSASLPLTRSRAGGSG